MVIKRYEFIERTLYLIRKTLEDKLSEEATLNEFIEEFKKAIERLF